ncbi:hypothetical protein [Amycolatopsis sp. H20-H5]|uniref:hypothetical protein n=1 Tax=Amycolatopsis sp. H20-H5 TaxID=3046309 RepID=UPI002DB6BEB5|nr:hypothetical protein [Amycolatopsis sp. H20-H5]MEC3975000.1 hypothetical protein [Amycolatopsis sp. H20-H5]
MSGVVIENNLLLSGFRFQIINLEEQAAKLANTDTTVRNNVLVRAEAKATTYRRSGKSTNEHFSANLELLDTSVNQRDTVFNGSRGPYGALTPQDFTDYRAYACARDIVDKGAAGTPSSTDVDGNPRVLGRAVDLGPFEIR